MANGFPGNGVDCESELENDHRALGVLSLRSKQNAIQNEALDVSGDSDG